jgi:hypothetical protein
MESIQVGMRVTGPGIPANTYVTGWYSPYTITLSRTTTAVARCQKFTFFFDDVTAMGAALGEAGHNQAPSELAYHSHQWFGANSQGGSHFPGGTGWGFTTNNTTTTGDARSANVLQPTLLMNKIIKT